MMEFIESMAQKGTISKEDMNLVLLTDNIDEAMTHISTYIDEIIRLNRGKDYGGWWKRDRYEV